LTPVQSQFWLTDFTPENHLVSLTRIPNLDPTCRFPHSSEQPRFRGSGVCFLPLNVPPFGGTGSTGPSLSPSFPDGLDLSPLISLLVYHFQGVADSLDSPPFICPFGTLPPGRIPIFTFVLRLRNLAAKNEISLVDYHPLFNTALLSPSPPSFLAPTHSLKAT